MWRIWPGLGLGFQGLGDETDEVLNDGYLGKRAFTRYWVMDN
jgi:hypothetical protein